MFERREKGLEVGVEWKILGRAKAFSPSTGRCNLCNLERLMIVKGARKQGLLNTREDFYSNCVHKHHSTLGYILHKHEKKLAKELGRELEIPGASQW